MNLEEDSLTSITVEFMQFCLPLAAFNRHTHFIFFACCPTPIKFQNCWALLYYLISVAVFAWSNKWNYVVRWCCIILKDLTRWSCKRVRLSLFSFQSCVIYFIFIYIKILCRQMQSPFLTGCNMVNFMVVDMFSMMEFPQLH